MAFETTKNEISFSFPKIEDERGEIKRVAHEFGEGNPQEFVETFIEQAKESGLITLNEEMWGRFENTDSFDIKPGDWETVSHHAIEGHPDHPRDWNKIKVIMEQGGTLPAPIICQKGNRLHLVSGNTRLMTARAFGKTPKILLVKID